jgi:hypothetical protein
MDLTIIYNGIVASLPALTPAPQRPRSAKLFKTGAFGRESTASGRSFPTGENSDLRLAGQAGAYAGIAS